MTPIHFGVKDYLVYIKASWDVIYSSSFHDHVSNGKERDRQPLIWNPNFQYSNGQMLGWRKNNILDSQTSLINYLYLDRLFH